MGKNRKFIKFAGAIFLLAALVVTYQNCGATGGSFNINYGNTSLPSGSITNTVQVTGKLTGGYYHECGISSTGGVKCWGAGTSGQLGYGALVAYSNTPVTVTGLTGTVVKVSAGPYYTCALLTNGTLQCWGDNTYGQLGNNTQGTNSPAPVTASVETNYIYDVATSFYSTCVVLKTGIVQCWGSNSNGELGNSSTSSSLTPVTVTGITNAVKITAGNEHFCATLSTGAVSCWGIGTSGQLGNQNAAQQDAPVSVNGLPSAVLKTVAKSSNTCALLATGGVSCWGDNTYGQLGSGASTPTMAVTNVINLTSASDLTLGSYTACALVNNSVKCWGYGGQGQLGNGATTSYSYPVSVSNMTTAVAIGAGSLHVCAMLSAGTVQCWGYNTSGQLGNGTITSSSVPVTVTGFL